MDTSFDKNNSYLVLGYFLRPIANAGDDYTVKEKAMAGVNHWAFGICVNLGGIASHTEYFTWIQADN